MHVTACTQLVVARRWRYASGALMISARIKMAKIHYALYNELNEHRTLPLNPTKGAQKRKMAVFHVKLHFA